VNAVPDVIADCASWSKRSERRGAVRVSRSDRTVCFSLVLLCCGCASPRQRTSPPANPAEVAVHLSAAATPNPTGAAPRSSLTLQTVVILQERARWGATPTWTNTSPHITVHGTVPVTVEAAD